MKSAAPHRRVDLEVIPSPTSPLVEESAGPFHDEVVEGVTVAAVFRVELDHAGEVDAAVSPADDEGVHLERREGGAIHHGDIDLTTNK